MTNTNVETNPQKQSLLSGGPQSDLYEIRIQGQLDESWTDWLEDLEMKLLDNGEMILSGCIKDQAALMGILNKLYSLNLSLRSVNEVSPNKV